MYNFSHLGYNSGHEIELKFIVISFERVKNVRFGKHLDFVP